jgi:hypothetical protein
MKQISPGMAAAAEVFSVLINQAPYGIGIVICEMQIAVMTTAL